ncbi:MAG: hypothetical protein J1G38_01555 [Clostridiales bacterium]|nr:hypothetical protein [Clostridiales bacterium]
MVKALKIYSCIAAALISAFVALFCGFKFSFTFAEAYEASAVAEIEQHVWTKEEVGTSLEMLRQAPADQIAQWDSYDSREFGIVTGARDQGNYGLCWAYGPLASMEIAILREGIDYPPNNASLILSHFALAKAAMGWYDDPLDLYDEDNANYGKPIDRSIYDHGANVPTATLVATRWFGTCNYTDFDNAQDGNGVAVAQYSPIRLESAVICNNKESEIKELIAAYGSVSFAYSAAGLGNNTMYYYTNQSAPNHVSAIVGWDDGISVESFKQDGFTVSRPGAWIVKNSWGKNKHDSGFYYLSYESYISQITAFDMMDSDVYDYNYNYAGNIPSVYLTQYASLPSYYNNEFMAAYVGRKGGDGKVESLKGVNVGVKGNNITADIKIYTDVDQNNLGSFDPSSVTPAVTTTETFKYGGFYTVELPEQVEIEAGSCYLIHVKLSSGAEMIYERDAAVNSTNDLTFYKSGTTSWMNFRHYYSSVAAIKGFTVVEDDTKQNIADCEFTLSENTFTYSGGAHMPTPTVKSGDYTLVAEQDYTFSYRDNVNAGRGAVVITGKGDYRGTYYAYFTIAAADITSATVTLSDNSVYDGREQKPLQSVVSDGKLLVQGVDYSVTYGNNINAGGASVTIQGQGNYSGVITRYFVIAKAERKVTATIKGWAYGELPNEPEIVWDEAERDKEVWYRKKGGEYTKAVPVDVGEYEIKIVFPQTYNYNAKEIVLPFTIEKAEKPRFDFRTDLEVNADDVATLSDIQLPHNWEWKNGDTAVIDGMTAVAVYVGEDRDSYKSVEIVVSITVIGGTEQPENPDDGKEEKPDPDPDPEPKPEPEPDPDDDTDSDEEKPDDNNSDVVEPDDDGVGAVAVAVGVGAGVAGVGAIGGAAYFVVRRRRRL